MDSQHAVQSFGAMLTALEGVTVLAKPRVSREVYNLLYKYIYI